MPEPIPYDLEQCFQLITRRCPELAGDVAQARKAVEVKSPMVARRFEHLVSRAMNSRGRDEMTTEEKLALAEQMIAMKEIRNPQKRFYKVISLTLPPSYLERVDEEAIRLQLPRADVIRRAIDALLPETAPGQDGIE